MNYLAIDFETANKNRASPCALGLCLIENFNIIEDYYFLINPETEFDPFNTRIHGITQNDVLNSPIFPEIWEEVKYLFKTCTIIAHNASFDISVLRHTLSRYNIEIPFFNYICTLKASRKINLSVKNNKLSTLCKYFDIELNRHHNAKEDAIACAKLFLILNKNYGNEIFIEENNLA
jgi:DNA polymerase-3 subunit epsilon